MPNLKLRAKPRLSPFRKIALGTWKTSYDPSVHGSLTLRVDDTMAYLEEFRQATGKRLTLSHLMAKAVGHVIAEVPDANAILRFNRIYLRERISVAFQVAMQDEKSGEVDLSMTTVVDPQTKTLAAIVDEFEATTSRVRSGKDKKETSRSLFRWLPSALVGPMLRGISFVNFGLNLNLEWMGIPNDSFGSVMVTNIGSIGLDEAYPPLVAFSRVPMVIAMGAVKEEPVVEGGRVVPGRVMRICGTFDHRVLDGAHAARMVTALKPWIEAPYDHFGAIKAVGAAP